MSNKSWDKINPIDKQIRMLSPNVGMTNKCIEPQVIITLIRGFELFNTRNYHNYETWSDGYRIELLNSDGEIFLRVEEEDLDDALNKIGILFLNYKNKDTKNES